MPGFASLDDIPAGDHTKKALPRIGKEDTMKKLLAAGTAWWLRKSENRDKVKRKGSEMLGKDRERNAHSDHSHDNHRH
ncbi:MAG: hypothetical protein UMU75_02500 [Halomonas sp.]|nr:hypothetical protein [Halomonas sp.]